MDREAMKKTMQELGEDYQKLSRKEKDETMLDYDQIGVRMPVGARETFKCPIYFENEGPETGTSFMLPGENPYEAALDLNQFYYNYRSLIAQCPEDQQVVAIQYNACIADIISKKMLTEYKINARSVMYSNFINLIRPYVINENNINLYGSHNKNIYDSILDYIPDADRATVTVTRYSRETAPITYTSGFFCVADKNGQYKYAESKDAFNKSMEIIQAYSVQLARATDNIIFNLVIPNIDIVAFADAFIKSINEDPNKYSPGDKQSYAISILLEQISNDYKKLMQLFEMSVMNAFSLFTKLRAPENTYVSVDSVRKSIDTLQSKSIYDHDDYIALHDDPQF